MNYSHRWMSSRQLDVDAYLLTDKSWLLFAFVKDEKLANDPVYFQALASKFQHGPVIGVSRALKREARPGFHNAQGSEPLPAVGVGQDMVPAEVWAREGWIRYRLETEKVLNPGLFLDQIHNREKLLELIQAEAAKGALGADHALLNLFSYTGSFSITALCAGVKSTTSVDVSSRYLAWEKQNFEANFGGLEVEHRLIADDARDFLRRAARKASEGGPRYRWIVVDPPTFSRGQGKPFRVDKDLVPMVEEARQCLHPEGAMLVSSNDARWDARAFYADVEKFARGAGLRVERGRTPKEYGADYPLKSVWLSASRSVR